MTWTDADYLNAVEANKGFYLKTYDINSDTWVIRDPKQFPEDARFKFTPNGYFIPAEPYV